LALFDRREIGSKIRTQLMGELSKLLEASKFLDEYEVVIV
jgi:hypothetical protein